MAIKIISHDYDFSFNKIKNALLNPLSSTERLSLTLSLENEGYVTWDSDVKNIFIWTGVEWINLSQAFINLTDTPSSYLNSSFKYLRVNSTEDGLEFHTITKSDIGLGNVDNTSDLNKPISTYTQLALDNKVDKSTTITALGDGIIGGGSLIQNRTFSLDFNYLDSRYTGYDETYTRNEIDKFFYGVSPIVGYNKSNWDEAYSWGDHALAGYLTVSSASATYIEKSRYIVDEIPSGVIDGVNDTFTLANTPLSGKLMFFINGLKLEAGPTSDYTITANVITVNSEAIPTPGDKLSVTYIY